MPTVLLVEDNEMNRDMLSRRLERKGFDVLIAVDGDECMSRLEEVRPDVILMDINLPGRDGYELTRGIKGDPDTAGIPVIALTAHAMAGDREKCIQAGCDDYDTKPVNMSSLLEKMMRLMES
jgi:CheY-like chemotaxis protein